MTPSSFCVWHCAAILLLLEQERCPRLKGADGVVAHTQSPSENGHRALRDVRFRTAIVCERPPRPLLSVADTAPVPGAAISRRNAKRKRNLESFKGSRTLATLYEAE